MNMLSKFIFTERFQYANNDNNRFAISLGQALRYYDFLSIIIDRCEKASRNMISISEKSMKLISTQTNGPVRMTAEQVRLMEESSRLMNLVHLEIESFYLFAKIFLDNVARFIYLYFGQVNRVKTKSHNNLAENHGKYFESKGLSAPQGLFENIMLLKNRICDYRDDIIAHEHSLRTMKGTAWDPSGKVRIIGGTFYPREGNSGANSEALTQLMDAIDVYLRQIITLIQSNRDRTRLKLKET